jgi:hypothetical protein
MNPGLDEDLNKVFLARLQDSVITLPWFLDKLRFNSNRSARARVEDVFRRVNIYIYNSKEEVLSYYKMESKRS